MSKPGETFRTMLAGITRYGKSYFFKNKLIEIFQSYKVPVVIFDRTGEYLGGEDLPKKYFKKSNISNGIYGFFAKMEKTGFLTNEVHIIEVEHERDYIQGLRFFEALGAPVILVLEEAHDIYNAPDMKGARVPLMRMARFGARKGISILAISQRYMDIEPKFRSQFEGIISFRQNEPGDIQEMSKKFFQAEAVKDLEKREYIALGNIPKFWLANIKPKLNISN